MSVNSCAICSNKNLKLIINLDWPLFRCQNCGLVQVYPLPEKSEVNKLYQGDYWKNYTPYKSQIKAHQKYFENKIIQIKNYRKNGRLLDIGCALGTLMKEAKKQGFQAEGIDISDYAVSQCWKLGLKTAKATVTDFIKIFSNGENIGYKTSARTLHQKVSVPKNVISTSYFDIITTFETLEHEYNPIKTVKTIYSLLKPTGLFVLTVPNTETLTNKIMGKFWFGYNNKEHLYHFNKKSLYLLLKQAGFQNIEIRKDSPRPYLFTYYLERTNFYLLHSRLFDKIIFKIKKVPVLANLELSFNPWGNLIAFANK